MPRETFIDRSGKKLKDFVVKLALDRAEDTQLFKRVKINLDTKDLHVFLKEQAIRFFLADPDPASRVDTSAFVVRFVYKDSQGDKIILENDEDVYDALKDADFLPFIPTIKVLASVRDAPPKTSASTSTQTATESDSKPPQPRTLVEEDRHPQPVRLDKVVEGVATVLTSTILVLQAGAKQVHKNLEAANHRVSARQTEFRHSTAPTEEPAPEAPRPFIHGRHTCDGCLTTPIVGKRYHATNVRDYDLCAICMKNYVGSDIHFEVVESLDRDYPHQERWYRRQRRSHHSHHRRWGHPIPSYCHHYPMPTEVVAANEVPPPASAPTEPPAVEVDVEQEDLALQEAIRRSMEDALKSPNEEEEEHLTLRCVVRESDMLPGVQTQERDISVPPDTTDVEIEVTPRVASVKLFSMVPEKKEASDPEEDKRKPAASIVRGELVYVHPRHTCDKCGERPIIGTRFHATNHPDYDLCEGCMQGYSGDLVFENAGLGKLAHRVPLKRTPPKPKTSLGALAVHPRHTCDGCKAHPVIGRRYHAINSDYDLCQTCHDSYKGPMSFEVCPPPSSPATPVSAIVSKPLMATSAPVAHVDAAELPSSRDEGSAASDVDNKDGLSPLRVPRRSRINSFDNESMDDMPHGVLGRSELYSDDDSDDDDIPAPAISFPDDNQSNNEEALEFSETKKDTTLDIHHESFADDAEGEVAELVGQILDNFATAVDDLNQEFTRVSSGEIKDEDSDNEDEWSVVSDGFGQAAHAIGSSLFESAMSTPSEHEATPKNLMGASDLSSLTGDGTVLRN